MAEPLKNSFGEPAARRLAAMLRAAHPAFPERAFLKEACAGLEGLELVGRARHLAQALRRALPGDYEQAVEIVLASLGPELDRTEGFGMAVFLYLPFVIFVAENGLGHFEASMKAQYELTKRFSAEFSIRAFLAHDPERTLARLEQWAADPNVHVRRLVSEGTRPRLPWAPRLRGFQADPRPILPLLERLRDDPELYVRRSVANNLNDIGKDHPALLLSTCARWMKGAPPARRDLVRHALRWQIKKGDPRALTILGFAGARGVRVEASFQPRRVRIGQSCRIAVSVHNRSRRAQDLAVDLAVHFVKAGGERRAKVFKVGELKLAPGEKATLAKTVSFAQHTTRRHYPGRHPVEVIVNGRGSRVGEVQVIQ
jgi:3-methyladenine DNA glycosylase AlkC